jgi:aryl-alcohol dehydrogenase-like predicted oxidoreductase
MHNIIERVKALYWGTSECWAEDILAAIEIAERHHRHKPVVEQPIDNLLERHRFSKDYARLHQDLAYGSTTWSPLASGLLTGKYKSGIPRDSRGANEGLEWLQEKLTDKGRLAKVSALEPLAREMGGSLAQFSLAWCLQNPCVSGVLTGATRSEQLHENMKAVDFVGRFTPELMDEIDRVLGIEE